MQSNPLGRYWERNLQLKVDGEYKCPLDQEESGPISAFDFQRFMDFPCSNVKFLDALSAAECKQLVQQVEQEDSTKTTSDYMVVPSFLDVDQGIHHQ